MPRRLLALCTLFCGSSAFAADPAARFAPPGALLVMRVDVPALLNDPALAPAIALVKQAGPGVIAKAAASFTPNPLTIKTVTFVLVPTGPEQAALSHPEGIVVVTTSAPFDQKLAREGIVGPNVEPTPVVGGELYAGGPNLAVVTPDANTLVVGDVTGVRVVLASKGISPLFDAALPAGDAIGVAANPKFVPEREWRQLPPRLTKVARGADMMAASYTPGKGEKFGAATIRAVYPTETAANQARDGIKSLIEQARPRLAEMRKGIEQRLAGLDKHMPMAALPEVAAAVGSLAVLNAADKALDISLIQKAGTELHASVEVPPAALTYVGLTGVGTGLLVPATMKVREAAATAKSMNNLKQIGIAMQSYHDAYGHLAAPAILSKDGKPLLSWRVAILPFIEQDNLYRRFKLDEPWDSPNNIKLIPFMPITYADPRATPAPAPPGTTFYKVFTGEGTPLSGKKRMQLHAISDGTSNTAMVVAAGSPVTWTKPDDIPFDASKPLPDLTKPFDQLLVAFCDGSVRALPASSFAKPEWQAFLKALVTANGGEVNVEPKP